jgi:PEGA domain
MQTRVYVDEKVVPGTINSKGEVKISSLRPGRHHVRLTLEGYDDFVFDVDLVAGQPSRGGGHPCTYQLRDCCHTQTRAVPARN